MIGEERTTVWTRLEHDAKQGDTSISLAGKKVDWVPGEEIIIAASGYNAYEYDLAVIDNVSFPASSPGGLVHLTAPLKFDHRIQHFLNGSENQEGRQEKNQWWRGLKLSPEVGLLSRNIRVVGGEDAHKSIANDGFGCRVIVGAVKRGFNIYSGKTNIDGVEFAYCGQSGFTQRRDPRYALVFKSIKGTSSVSNSAFHHNFNGALGVHLSNGVTLNNNVVFETVGSGVIVGGSSNKVTSNLAIMMKTLHGVSFLDKHAISYPSMFEIGGVDNEVRDNAAGGSERISFSFIGSGCNSDQTALGKTSVSNPMFWLSFSVFEQGTLKDLKGARDWIWYVQCCAGHVQ